ncbi:hypothetical protein GTO91_00975 [Heliobacterium undosum]|uniref:Uncharacterized protein n=1 Tax=Heliomicrobium undosum TaxID=121734 RepID=A0A845KYY8_9FIRM|nr:CBO0543 family protein [Heliomicrobium undosum]MZP28296.1 hypothetical protein [Heliomicrobium undosum]
MENYELIQQTREGLSALVLSRYLSTELFTFNWWFLLAILIGTYALWWKIIEKKRLLELLLFGSFIAVSVGFVEGIGTTSGIWGYKYKLVPIVPSLFPFDYTLVPIIYMTIYQYTTSWRTYFTTTSVASALYAFGFNPLLVSMDILHIEHWNHIYNFILLLTISNLARFVLLSDNFPLKESRVETCSAPFCNRRHGPSIRPKGVSKKSNYESIKPSAYSGPDTYYLKDWRNWIPKVKPSAYIAGKADTTKEKV